MVTRTVPGRDAIVRPRANTPNGIPRWISLLAARTFFGAKLPSLMIGSLLDGVVVVAAADAQSIASTGERLRQVGPFALFPARASALNWVV